MVKYKQDAPLKVAMNDIEYRFIHPPPDARGRRRLSDRNSPDLPGCMSDGGDHRRSAGQRAPKLNATGIAAAMQAAGRADTLSPTVEAAEAYSGKWVLRTPKSLHRGLAERARQEGVSLNTPRHRHAGPRLGQRQPRDS